ncbi:unnamed protein product [Nezara viridula]|uniref:Uncharacterized protein n=1 Tax=Nezara viridula TaxID=85310 RepID=A0A9P0MIE8_NEZVI|nr:unnamed protein product [Nezara viridula]
MTPRSVADHPPMAAADRYGGGRFSARRGMVGGGGGSDTLANFRHIGPVTGNLNRQPSQHNLHRATWITLRQHSASGRSTSPPLSTAVSSSKVL